MIKFSNTLEASITKNLHEANIITRDAKSHGLWCALLLPTILFLNTICYKVSPAYTLVAYVSVGLLCYSLLFIVFTSISCVVLRERVYGGSTAPGLISALLIYIFLEQGLVFSLLISIPTVWAYNTVLRYVLNTMPHSFTLGEAMVIVQSLVLFTISTIINVWHSLLVPPETDMEIVSVIVHSGLAMVGLIVAALYIFHKNQGSYKLIASIISSGTTVLIVFLHLTLHRSPILWIIWFALQPTKVKLVSVWLVAVIVAALCVYSHINNGEKASTAARKSFHVLAVLVFTPGILMDLPLMCLAAGLAFAALILLEAIRKSGLQPFASKLQSAFVLYADEKDAGGFSLTPLYLFIGIACPLLLVPNHKDNELELLSGVFSVGIGDAAASWYGSNYGKYKWMGTNRTKEGTIVNVGSQIVFAFILSYLGILDIDKALFRVAIAAFVAGAVEAKTDQVDNLVLPLVTLLVLQITGVWTYLNQPIELS